MLSSNNEEFPPAALQALCKLCLDLLRPIAPLFYSPSLCESLPSCSLILPPGDPLCSSKWLTSLISPLLVTLAPSPSLSLHLCASSACSWCARFPGFEPECRSLKTWEHFSLPNSQLGSARRQRRPTRLQLCSRADASAFQEPSDDGWRERECARYVAKRRRAYSK